MQLQCLPPEIALQSISTDQDGIATVEYSADGAFFASDGAAQRVAPSGVRGTGDICECHFSDYCILSCA